ncbi:hypothetical protein BDV29DRAFT_168514 [Aspergillus leporis]|uniref:Uncharacterized protein n=1 Tax=Aspergillus leporis TaxID=41062 RepID=A0A5N5XCV7_9EURO|nr:hypothetical protein BDV29DRAFT_168514 [Aspergillus leporis]
MRILHIASHTPMLISSWVKNNSPTLPAMMSCRGFTQHTPAWTSPSITGIPCDFGTPILAIFRDQERMSSIMAAVELLVSHEDLAP